MRKYLSHFLLIMVLMALAAPSVSAQVLAKSYARTSSPQAKQFAPDRRSRGPQMHVRDASSGFSTNMRKVHTGTLPSVVSINEQMRRAADGIALYGNVLASNYQPGTGERRTGLWSFTTEGEFLQCHNPLPGLCYASVFLDGVLHNYYVIQFFDLVIPVYEAWDVNTWKKVSRPTYNITMEDMPNALCTDGIFVYGQHYSYATESFRYGKFNLNTNKWTDIVDMSQQWNACAYGNDGYIYAVDMAGDCYKVVPTTGAATLVGATGVVPRYITGAVVDKASGRMFWTVCPEDQSGNLYEVNTATGVANKLCQFQYNDEVAGLFIPFSTAANVPAAVENIQANFVDGNLTGTIDFKCPTTLFDGTAATGALTYTIIGNNEILSTGSCAFGEQVSAPITLPAAGEYTVTVFVTNEAGIGPKTDLTTPFIGKDTPKPTNVSIIYADGKFNVSWEAATSTVNGGYMDLSKVNYTVTRFPDNVVVGSNVVGTSLQDPVAIPDTFTNFHYTVVVNCEGLSSSAAQSNRISLGELLPPYSEDFNNPDQLEDFTIIDGNNDDNTWAPYVTDDGACVTEPGEKVMQCRWNMSIPMDDWLIAPAFKLEAGKAYRVSFDVGMPWDDELVERVELKMGNDATAEAMNVTVIPATDFKTNGWFVMEAYVVPEVTGRYFFGIHGISDPDQFRLYVDNFSVSAPMEAGAPEMATELVATTDPDGALKATISGKAPLTTISGSALTSVSKIELVRDGNVVNTITNVAPGANFSIEDATIPESNTYTWTVICYNEKGAGKAATVSGYAGLSKPSFVENIKMVETTTGTVSITWDAPVTDINGTFLGDTPITYTIVDATDPSVVIASNLTETSYTYQAVAEGEQEFLQVGIFAMTNEGKSQGAAGPFRVIGTPYQAPWVESFAGHELSSLLGISNDVADGAAWAINADGDFGINSCDNDDGFINGQFYNLDGVSTIFTGKIDLSSVVNPTFSFFTYDLIGPEGERDINEIQVLAREANSDTWTVLKSGTVDDLCNGHGEAWNKIFVSLDAFKGKVVQVGVKSICKVFAISLLDKLMVEDMYEHNLAVFDIDAPETVSPKEQFTVTAEVENRGANTAEGYTVEFYRNDESTPFKTYTGSALAPGARASYKISTELGYGENEGSVRFHAVVVYAADLYAADNASEEVTVTRKYADKPAPTNLVGDTEGNRVSLNWTAPAMGSRRAFGDFEDFESYDAWTYENVGEWTFLDLDQSPTGGFQSFELPGSPIGVQRSFIVFKGGEDAGAHFDTFQPHSGSQFLGSLFCVDRTQNNDWLISPKLSGAAQVVTFWAKSYDSQNPEKIEMLYSTSGKDASDFVSVQVVDKVPVEWTQYTIELPAGANYFAVRNCATDKFLLMLDDFSFETVVDAVVGYNVYRDNVKLNSELITGTSFVDENCPLEGNPGYVVTAVYASGAESAPTEVYHARGVEAIEAGVIVEAGNGFIAIAGAEGKQVSITAVNGIRYFNRIAEGDVRIELAAGVYLVRVANGSVKVVVK